MFGIRKRIDKLEAWVRRGSLSTDERMDATDKQMAATDKRLKRLERRFEAAFPDEEKWSQEGIARRLREEVDTLKDLLDGEPS